MIILEKSEFPFLKCPTKIILLSHQKKCQPLEKRNLNHPPPYLYLNHHTPCVFLSFQFPLLKKTDNAQLCTGKIRAYIVIRLRTGRV